MTQTVMAGGGIGFLKNGSKTSFALTGTGGSATWFAMGIMVATAETLNTLRAYINAFTGTPNANNLGVELYSDNGSGAPNASLQSITGSVTAAGWLALSGLTSAMTAGVQYWLVFKNLDQANCTISIGRGAPLLQPAGFTPQATTFGWCTLSSANGGSTWASISADPGYVRLGFASGRFAGFTVHDSSGGTVSTTDIYGKRVAGARWIAPANLYENIGGVNVWLRKLSTPSNLLVKLYINDVLMQTSPAIVAGQANTTGFHVPIWFPTATPWTPGDKAYAILRSSVDTDPITTTWRSAEMSYDTDAASVALMGDFQQQSIFDTDDSVHTLPSQWTLVNTMYSMQLLLASGAPFNSSGGGSGGAPLLGDTLLLTA